MQNISFTRFAFKSILICCKSHICLCLTSTFQTVISNLVINQNFNQPLKLQFLSQNLLLTAFQNYLPQFSFLFGFEWAKIWIERALNSRLSSSIALTTFQCKLFFAKKNCSLSKKKTVKKLVILFDEIFKNFVRISQ